MWHDWHIKKMVGLVDSDKIKNGNILDNGCGVGVMAEYLPGERLMGTDISPEMVKLAQGRMKNVQVAPSEKLPFKDGTFDVVFSRALLHHLEKPEEALLEVNRVLKKDGQAVFSDTLSSILSSLPRKFAYKSDHFSELHKNFNRKEIISLLGEYFHVDNVVYFGYLAYPFALPDIANILKWLPFKHVTMPFLIFMDSIIMKIPLLNRQAWGIMIRVSKKI